MTQNTNDSLKIPQDLGGLRLDLALQQLLPEHSRSRLQAWIKEGLITIDGATVVAKTKVWGGEQVEVNQPPNLQENAFNPE
ncbi:MAG: S4 domain-containing protein, partial [Methylophilaceae bacterium]|nr:S4 domain-containing protein [Methylophilaceae bacterium]